MCNELTETEQQEVLIHEILHSIMCEWNIASNLDIDVNLEEKLVDTTAKGLTQVLGQLFIMRLK